MENAYFTLGAGTQPATAITVCVVLENALFYAWSKNPTVAFTAWVVLENVVLCLYEIWAHATVNRTMRCWRMLFGARSGT